MTIESFFKVVEIQTKLASVFPFIIGTLYSYYMYGIVKPLNIIIMFISLICFDMATTAINNYMDYKKAIKKEGYGFEHHNGIVKYNLKKSEVITTILVLIIIAVCAGIYLTYLTGWITLFIGVISFITGILYSFGPIPISRMPLGEIFSGFFMGFIILFLSVYINIYDMSHISMMIENWNIVLNLNIIEIIKIFLISMPLFFSISNIMLANNISDLEEDIANKRYTLPYYLGKKNALNLWRNLYYISYADLLMLMILGWMPWTTVIGLATIIPVTKHIGYFMKKQTKKDTFIYAVKNLGLISISYIISLILGIFFKSI
ncbi:1,4-dihydroxy-2-naphthoate polyprenyltransferase [Oceanotoga sp. DSM 15011]|uniref:1,4-dihydroxy-2-naphthoate polyprenyltransferase n=1 Tax=Oceanotoga sp. DSM 15011 TaxID=2984951 RepID=UPI0021F4F32A|nr:1,4-dihydroxy-2-naphthoate polyprenyltransferase [Oceanotoga sp. DSM 15011]UYP01319.1 1,4-dihydroxy-2-naphthoate polyprenyltransferase [Oceanotoga sp. DSM 15011]